MKNVLVIDQSGAIFDVIKSDLKGREDVDLNFTLAKDNPDEYGGLDIHKDKYDIFVKVVYAETIIEHILKISQKTPVVFVLANDQDQVETVLKGIRAKYLHKKDFSLDKLIEVSSGFYQEGAKGVRKFLIKELIFKTVMEETSEGIIIIDRELKPMVVNSSAEKLLGPACEDPLMTFDAKKGFFLTKEDAETMIEDDEHPLRLALSGTQTKEMVVFCKHQGTTTGFWLKLRARPLRESGKGIFGAVLLIKDFTSNKMQDIEMENKLTELTLEREKLELVLASMKDGVVMIDKDGKTLFHNQAANEMFGPGVFKMTSPKDDWDEFSIYDEDGENLIEENQLPTNRALKGEVVDDYRMFVSHIDSYQGFWVGVTTRPFYDDKKERIIGALVVIHNETRTKIQEINEEVMITKLKSSYEKMKTLNEEKDTLMAMVKHDLVNPIGAIQGIAELYLEEKFDFEEGNDFIKSIFDSSKNLAKMVKSMLSESRFAEDIHEKEFPEMSVFQLFGDVSVVSTTLAKNKSINLLFNKPEEDIIFKGESLMLERTVENIITNAIKFTPQNGTVTFSAESKNVASKNYLILSVKDTGTGMSQEVIDSILKGEVESQEGTSGEKGTGLGISFVKKTVESHEGRLDISSTPGQGSEFKITIPIYRDKKIAA